MAKAAIERADNASAHSHTLHIQHIHPWHTHTHGTHTQPIHSPQDAIIGALRAQGHSTEAAPFDYPANYVLPPPNKVPCGDGDDGGAAEWSHGDHGGEFVYGVGDDGGGDGGYAPVSGRVPGLCRYDQDAPLLTPPPHHPPHSTSTSPPSSSQRSRHEDSALSYPDTDAQYPQTKVSEAKERGGVGAVVGRNMGVVVCEVGVYVQLCDGRRWCVDGSV